MNLSQPKSAFADFDEVNQELIELREKIKTLCDAGEYDKATRLSDDQMQEVHKRWMKELKNAIKKLKENPDFYVP